MRQEGNRAPPSAEQQEGEGLELLPPLFAPSAGPVVQRPLMACASSRP